jgi:type III pantothenate kinase
MTVLEIDLGNSRLKWRVQGSEGASVSMYGALERRTFDDVAKRFPDISAIRYASVATDSACNVLERQLYRSWPRAAVVRVQTRHARNGVTIAYQEPARLGVDRWLAMLAAHNKFPPQDKVIVDCGSALTVDLLRRSGTHVGGYIVPGMAMMRHSLQKQTARVNPMKLQGKLPTLEPGVTTEAAVGRGIGRMMVALITDVARDFALQEPLVIITGGGAELLLPHLQLKVTWQPDLVLDGLVHAAPVVSR